MYVCMFVCIYTYLIVLQRFQCYIRNMMNHIGILHEGNITSYYKPSQQLERLGREMQTFIVSPKYCVPFSLGKL